MKKIYLILFSVILLNSCVKDIAVGYLSDNIEMREDTVRVVKGLYQVSAIPMVDGSTRPLNFEITRIYDLVTGQDASEFYQVYPVKLWTSSYNPDTDTTMAIVNQKLFVKDVSPLEINPVSGQLAFNGGTANIEGELYGIDVRVNNETSSKDFKQFGTVKFTTTPWEAVNNFGEYFYAYSSYDPSTNHSVDARASIGAAEMAQVYANTHPHYSIEKVGESDEVNVKLTFLDSNDQAFPGIAINKWPSGASYLNSWFDNSLDTKILSDGVEFNFPTVPFPAFGRSYTGGRESISLSYYVLHPDYYTLTPEAIAMANALGVSWNMYNLQVKIVYQINEPGVWEVKVKFKYALKK